MSLVLPGRLSEFYILVSRPRTHMLRQAVSHLLLLAAPAAEFARLARMDALRLKKSEVETGLAIMSFCLETLNPKP